MDLQPDSIVASALARLKHGDRGLFLRQLLAHAAAGLVVIEDEKAAAEAVYRLGDAIVSQTVADAQ